MLPITGLIENYPPFKGRELNEQVENTCKVEKLHTF